MGSGQEMEFFSVAYTALGEECEPNTTTIGVNGVETLSQAMVQKAIEAFFDLPPAELSRHSVLVFTRGFGSIQISNFHVCPHASFSCAYSKLGRRFRVASGCLLSMPNIFA